MLLNLPEIRSVPEIGDAAGGGAEAVEEPGEFFEGVEFENF